MLFQEYVNAALMLMAMHAPLNSGNPYSSLNSESGFSTFDFPQVQVLAAEVTARAKRAWFQKWFVHRLLRPEAFGGLVHFSVIDKRNPSARRQRPEFRRGAGRLQPQRRLLCSHLLSRGKSTTSFISRGTRISGHATVAGACVTVLKWFFSESFVIPNPLGRIRWLRLLMTAAGSCPTWALTQIR